jgi:hypothetical protein
MMVFAVGRDAMLERNRRSQPPSSDTATPKALATLLGGGVLIPLSHLVDFHGLVVLDMRVASLQVNLLAQQQGQ